MHDKKRQKTLKGGSRKKWKIEETKTEKIKIETTKNYKIGTLKIKTLTK
mgnify:CR=1 FL=1